MSASLLLAELIGWLSHPCLGFSEWMDDKERMNGGVHEYNTCFGDLMLWACNVILNRQGGKRKLSVWWPFEAH